MSFKLYEKLNLKIIPNSSITIDQVNGQTRSIGRLQIQLQIANKTSPITFHVMEHFKYPLLLGLDAGNIFGLQIDLKHRKICLHSNNHPKKFIAYHLETTQSDKLNDLLQKYINVFSQNDTDIGRITIAKHHIHTVAHPPIQLRPYRRPQSDYDEIRRQIMDLKEKGLIRESDSPWSFPITLDTKKDGTKRLCIDFRRLNTITIDDKMPMPHIHEVLDRLQGARYFTTLDIAWGFWHVEMHPESITKTAFVTNEGHYEWMVMPFGLKNAPATFQRIIQKTLGSLLYRGVINYLDDFIIYSETFEQHLSLLEDVFRRLNENNIKLKLSKCYFVKSEVEYLGHIVSHNSVKPSTRKVQAVQEFAVPTNLREVRRFLGLTGYYRRFIDKFSVTAKPLTNLTRKDIPFHWTHEHQVAFETLRDAIIKPPVLAIYDPAKPCILYTDASKIGIGATLAQKDDDNTEHVIAYFSRRLNQHQENYSASELECLAVVESIDHFEVYLDKHFSVITDHSALRWLLTNKQLKGKLYRWSIKLSTKSFDIIHRPGRSQQHVDALSRAPISFHLTPEQLKTAQDSSDLLYVRNPHVRHGVVTIRHRGLFKAVVPENLRQKLLQEYHDNHSHPGKNKTVKLITPYYWWPMILKDIKQHVSSCKTCQLTKHNHQPTPGKFVIPESDLEPMEVVGLDTIVMGPAANNTRHKYIQVFIDHLSRYVWAYQTASNTAATIKTLLTNLHNSGIKIRRIITDNHKNFNNKLIKSYLHQNQVKHSFSSTYHPQTNGIVEKVNGTIITKLRAEIFDKPKRKWSTLLTDVVRNYNDTPHDTTGFSPRYLLFGVDPSPSYASPSLTLEAARQIARERTNISQQKRKEIHDSKDPSIEFEVGDLVTRKIASNHPSLNKTSRRRDGPLIIINKLSPVTYDVSDSLSGTPSRVHVSQLKRFIARQET
jgi:transposase InsO family protein